MNLEREPLVTTAGITALAAAIIALFVAFGLPITSGQQDAIMGFIIVIAPLAVALIGRAFVTPVAAPQDNEGVPLVRVDGKAAR